MGNRRLLTRSFLILAVIAAGAALAPGHGQAARQPVVRAPSPEVWVHAAETGAPLKLDTGRGNLVLRLEENTDLFAPGTVVRDATGSAMDMSGVHALRGTIDGFADSIVRVTIWDDGATGFLFAPFLGEMQIGPRSDGTLGLLNDASLLEYPHVMVDREPGDPVDHLDDHSTTGLTTDCFMATPAAIASPTGLVLGWPVRTFDVAFAVDAEFAAVYGAGWPGVLTAIANGVDAIFEEEMSLSLSVVDMHSHAAGVFPGGDTDALLGNLEAHYESGHVGLARENVHLLTGKDLLATSGVVGQANCIGGAGNPDIAYTVALAANFDPINILGLIFYGDLYVKLSAHEMGHILSAHHHYANCTESAPGLSPFRPIDLCTVMFPFADHWTRQMSSVNRLVTRGWADGVSL